MTTIVTTTDAITRAAGAFVAPEAAAQVAAAVANDPHTATLAVRGQGMLYQAALAWEARCKALGLRKGTKGRTAQLVAFLQGILAVLTSGHYMTDDEAQRAAFLVSVGRGEELVRCWLEGEC